ncbi:MAG: glycosyltransferase family 4 protein [Candidatus Puniceispirillales bacterium]
MATTFQSSISPPLERSSQLSGKVIVQILPELEKGGVERGTIEMAAAITAAGGRAIVISHGGALVARLQRVGGEHYNLPVHSKNPLKWPGIRRKVRQILKLTGADLVHIRSRAPAWIAMPAARSLGIPVVTTIHGRFRRENPLKNVYNGKLLKSDRVIAISNHIHQQVVDVFPQMREKMKIIHRGVDTDVFSPDKVTAQRVIRMAEKLAAPDDIPIIVLPARPTVWKGAHVLIEAAAHITDEHFMILLVGALDGSPEFQKGLISTIEKVNMTSRVRLCESVDDMAAMLMLADVVAMPSLTPEPFGRVAIEASAMGCPVVAFNHGGARESIIDGVTGWLAEPVEVLSLAACLRKALGLKTAARKKLSAEARKMVQSRFTTTRMCADTIAVYADLLK